MPARAELDPAGLELVDRLGREEADAVHQTECLVLPLPTGDRA